MLAVAIIMACVWFGVGVLVGWQRSKNAYQIEFAKFPYFAETDPGSARRSALLRGSAVFLGWAVAGLFGAILWFLLYVFLIIGRAAAEESSQSSSKKRNSSFWFWLLTGGLLLITNESLRSIEGNVDDFVIKLALVITFLAFVVAMIATGQ